MPSEVVKVGGHGRSYIGPSLSIPQHGKKSKAIAFTPTHHETVAFAPAHRDKEVKSTRNPYHPLVLDFGTKQTIYKNSD